MRYPIRLNPWLLVQLGRQPIQLGGAKLGMLMKGNLIIQNDDTS